MATGRAAAVAGSMAVPAAVVAAADSAAPAIIRRAPVAAARSVRADRTMTLRGAALLFVLSAAAGAQTQTPIKFEPTTGVPTFAVREPVLRIKPGATVETRTFSRPGDYYERAGGAWPGEVGPFYIEGATPNDTLVVRIVRLRLNRDTAVSQLSPNGISGVAGDSRTRMLNDPLPARRFEWKLDRTRNVGILEIPSSASKRF